MNVMLVATNNIHKRDELASLLAPMVQADFLTLEDAGLNGVEPIEDGATLEENAYIKAREFFDVTGMPTIADDTGLEVAALGGRPGVLSARFAGSHASYADNVTLLLRELRGSEGAQRSARFRTVICYCDAFRSIMVEGVSEGVIAEERVGEGGFGYDPVFVPANQSRTFGEMTPAEKNALSHRGRAVRALAEVLHRILG